MKKLLISLGVVFVLSTMALGAQVEIKTQQLSKQITSVTQSTQKFGAFNPTGGGTYYLQASINSSQTTVTLTSFTEPSSNIPYTMSYLNSSIEYGTINPNSPTSEFISFSGITQNSNGTALLTGVVRGLGRSYPYTASTTLAHSVPGQTQFILSAPPQFYNQYYVLQNNATSSGILTFGSTTPPRYDATPITANFPDTILADIAYVNSVVAAGAANASETVKGIIQLATNVQLAAGTSLGSTAARLAIPNSLATSTPTAACTSGCVAVAVNGKLSQGFLDLTQLFTFVGGLLSTGSSTFVGTTTINASNVLNNAVIFHGIPYAFPSIQGGASTILTNNGSGVLSWGGVSKYSLISSTGVAVAGPGYATSTPALAIPAGTLSASSTITVLGQTNCSVQSSQTCTFYLRDTSGVTLASCAISSGASSTNWAGVLNMFVTNQSSLTSQASESTCTVLQQSGTVAVNGGSVSGNSTVSSFNTANALNLVMVVQTSNNITSSLSSFSIVVNP